MGPWASRFFLTQPARVAAGSKKWIRILMALALLLSILQPGSTASAQSGGPEDPAAGAAGKMLQIFIRLGKLFINIAYGFMFLIFAVGSVKSGLGAQAAQQFGATGRVSLENSLSIEE